ncbi:MAG: SPOR domain-containing protein [Bradyrhizobium sp.]|uniref:SPOR domain-containing protein n=1 Tax=Bradyrhizobium sp. TaxID=376 RepID=UPI0023A6FFDA|nr:SPOR domain-containing protein [Bradyrhizobium sp.]MDE2601983.1 SPOR domain-containing protein [Bradyrhizobium sp.]
MADRYQDRRYPADDGYDRGDDQHAAGRDESDPLAELARLIGQPDPFAHLGGRANQPAVPRSAPREPYPPPVEVDDVPQAGPPPWMQRAARQDTRPQDYPPQDYLSHPSQDYSSQDYPSQDYPSQDYPAQNFSSAEHPLRRYAAQHADPAPDYGHAPAFAEVDQPVDPSRYDDALYGPLDADGQHGQHDLTYSDDPYAYRDGYDESTEEQGPKRRRSLTTVMAVLALAVVGTGGAFAYRTYVGSARSGEPPIIKADTSPTKIVPAAADSNAKVPDRLAMGDGTEKIVPREEAPVDVNANTTSGPRMVFPTLNQNPNPPSPASVAPDNPPPSNVSNGTIASNQPRPIRTFSVRGDQPDGTAVPVTAAPAVRPAASTRAAAASPRGAPATAVANASANAPLSLSPQAAPQPAETAAETRTRMATNTPGQVVSTGSTPASGGYLVQVSSQRNEAEAQASYRVLQGKFPSVLGSHSPVIRRADLGAKGVYYRAMVGPFGSSEEASHFCSSLKSAGGQCVIQRN